LRSTGQKYAVKIFRSDDEEKLLTSVKEFEIQKDLKHPNVVEVI
jgi:hypothetical protein